MSRAASKQSTLDVSVVMGDTFEGVTDTILDDEAPDALTSTSAEETVSQVNDHGLLSL